MKDKGILAIKGDPSAQANANPMMNPMMSDPTQMMGMMKNNMAMIVPQVHLYIYFSYLLFELTSISFSK